MKNIFTKVIQEYSRAKENRINDEILDSSQKHNTQICDLIDRTLNKGHHVWLMTDWHLMKYNKETGAIYERPETKRILKHVSIIQPEDLLIYLGDICDGEVERKKDIANYIKQIPGRKILIRGNNDLFDDKWYLDNGWDIVTPKFIWKNILFSHRPQDNDNKMNIHGHIHGSKKYYASEITHYRNQIDVAWLGGREKPIELDEVISKQPEYANKSTFINKPWGDDPRVDERKK